MVKSPRGVWKSNIQGNRVNHQKFLIEDFVVFLQKLLSYLGLAYIWNWRKIIEINMADRQTNEDSNENAIRALNLSQWFRCFNESMREVKDFWIFFFFYSSSFTCRVWWWIHPAVVQVRENRCCEWCHYWSCCSRFESSQFSVWHLFLRFYSSFVMFIRANVIRQLHS